MTKMVRSTHTVGSGLTPEQLASIEEASRHPIVYSKDCPQLSDEQLAEFKPANFDSMEERHQAMIEAGIITEDKKETVLVH